MSDPRKAGVPALLRYCVQRVRDKRPETADALGADLDAQDIITLNLTRAVQISLDIVAHILAETKSKTPDTMGRAFQYAAESGIIDSVLAAQMIKAVGFRNIAIHNYQIIDWTIVHSISHTELKDFETFATAIVACLDKSSEIGLGPDSHTR